MKNLFILMILIFFAGCEKEEIRPTKQLVNVELYAYSLTDGQIGVNITITGESVNIEDNMTIILDPPRGQVIYRQSFYLDVNKSFTVKVINNKTDYYTLRLDAYTKEGRRLFEPIGNSSTTLKLSDNWYNDIVRN